VNTDSFGLFNLIVGAGAVQSGSMNSIQWSTDNFYLKVGMDITGGTNFLTMGTTQLLSVPYALHAATADSIVGGNLNEIDPVFNASVAAAITAADTANWNNEFSGNYFDLTNIPITVSSISTNGDTLHLSNGQTFISGSNNASLPTITTDNVTQNQSATSVNVATTILNDGGETIINRGICFGTNSNLTTSNSLTLMIGTYGTNGGSILGSMSNSITGLITGTQYYFRSFAVNVKGTAYGQVIPFTTQVVTLPQVSTYPVTNIQSTIATLNGELIDWGNDTPYYPQNAAGICYSTSPNPTINDNTIIGGPNFPLIQGDASCQPNTTYYARAYATNILGTGYGNEVIFTTLP
jgi:hypothetical protein